MMTGLYSTKQFLIKCQCGRVAEASVTRWSQTILVLGRFGNVFTGKKTGNVHVCDDACKEVICDPVNELLVCTISGRCFDRLLSPCETEGGAVTCECCNLIICWSISSSLAPFIIL